MIYRDFCFVIKIENIYDTFCLTGLLVVISKTTFDKNGRNHTFLVLMFKKSTRFLNLSVNSLLIYCMNVFLILAMKPNYCVILIIY